jgi:hypothetical protein
VQSSLIGKIEKARRYAGETERISFTGLSVQFRGDNDTYTTGLKNGKWSCTCHFFTNWGICSHTMALEKVLSKMLPKEALTTEFDVVP